MIDYIPEAWASIVPYHRKTNDDNTHYKANLQLIIRELERRIANLEDKLENAEKEKRLKVNG